MDIANETLQNDFPICTQLSTSSESMRKLSHEIGAIYFLKFLSRGVMNVNSEHFEGKTSVSPMVGCWRFFDHGILGGCCCFAANFFYCLRLPFKPILGEVTKTCKELDFRP